MSEQETKHYPSPNSEILARRAKTMEEYNAKMLRKEKHHLKKEEELYNKELLKNKAFLEVKQPFTNVTLISDTTWTLSKTPTFSQNMVDWKLDITKGKESDKILTFTSFIMVTNHGCGVALLANVVSNLQVKDRHNKWKTITTNLVNNHEKYCAKYTEVWDCEGVYGYTKNHASVSVDLIKDGNSSLDVSLLPGESANFVLVSKFNASCIHFKKTDEIRLENIISFGNVMDGKKLNVNEHLPKTRKVVSYWMHEIIKIPKLVRHGQQVLLSDPASNLVPSDGASFSNYTSFGDKGVETLTDSQVRHVTVIVNNLGMLSNKATLTSETGILEVSSTVDLVSRDEFKDPDYLTLTRKEWASSSLLEDNFNKVYPTHWISVGNTKQILLNLRGIKSFLNGDYLAPGLLTQSLVNPLTSSAGSLALELLTLKLNIDYNDKGLTGTDQVKLRDLIYSAPIGDMLNGITILNIFNLANNILDGSSPLPNGYSLQGLTDLLHNINSSFVNNQVSAWAIVHLRR